MPTTGNQLADFFVKVGVLAKDFDKEWLRIERTVKEAKSSNKFAFNFKVDPTNLKSLNKELDRLKARAAELRGNLLTVKPTVENPNAVADLEHELSKVEHQMQLVSKAADDVRAKTNRLKEVGDKIGSVGSKLTLGLTAPIMALGGFVAMMAQRQADYAESMENLSQSSGLSVRNLQVLKFIADEAGLSFENVTTAAGMVQQKLMGVEEDSGMAAKAFARLGINVHDGNGQLRSMNELFPELIKKLQGMGNQTERNMLASQIFGRGWRELAPILGMTAAEMDAAAKRAEELGVVLGDDAMKKSLELDKALDDLKMQFVGLGRSIVTDLIPTLKNDLIPLLEKLVKYTGDAAKWFNGLPEPVKKFAFGLLLAVAALGPLLKLIGGAVSIYAQLKLAQMAGTVATAGLTAKLAMSVAIIADVTARVLLLAYAWNKVTEGIRLYKEKQEAIEAANRAAEQDKRGDKIAADYIAKRDKSIKKSEQKKTDQWRKEGLIEAVHKTPADPKDIEAASKRRMEIAKREADAISRLNLERKEALAAAAGPLEKKAINEDFDAQIRDKRAEYAKEQQKELEGLRNTLEESDRMIRDATAHRLAAQGQTYQAEMLLVESRYQQEIAQVNALRDARQKAFAEERKQITDAYNAEIEGKNKKQQKKVWEAYHPAVNNLQDAEAMTEAELSNRQLSAAAERESQITEINRREADKRKAIWRAEAQAQGQAQVDALKYAGRENDAQYVEIVNSYRQAMQDIADMNLSPFETMERQGAAWWSMAAKIKDLNKEIAEEEKRRFDESERRALDSSKKQIEAYQSVLEWAQGIAQGAQDKLIGALYGDSAVKLNQIDREEAARKKQAESEIRDKNLLSGIITSIEVDAAIQRSEVEQQEYDKRLQSAREWVERMRDTVSFSGIESLWKRMDEGSTQAMFRMPQMQAQFAAPNMNVTNSMNLSNVTSQIDTTNKLQAEGVRALKSIDAKLETN